jgi:hypothetical protein
MFPSSRPCASRLPRASFLQPHAPPEPRVLNAPELTAWAETTFPEYKHPPPLSRSNLNCFFHTTTHFTYLTMAAAYPPGGTFFQTINKSFADVPVDESKDNAISTTEFLEAAESTTTLFDVLGSVAFKPVKGDMSGNIKVREDDGSSGWSCKNSHANTGQKIRDRQLAAPAQSETLQELCLNELKEKKHTATEGLLWLTR